MSLFTDFVKTTSGLVNTAKSVVNKVANTEVPLINSGMNVGPKITPKKIVNTVADLTVRPVARVGFETTQSLNKDKKTYTPNTPATKALLGTAPLKNYNDPTRTSATVAKKIGAPKLAIPLALAGAAADVTSLLPETGVGKAIAKKVITKAPEEIKVAKLAGEDALAAAAKFGRTLNSYKQEAKNKRFVDELQLKRLFPEGVDVKKPSVKATGLKINDVLQNLREQGKNIKTAVQDQSGFINFGTKIGEKAKEASATLPTKVDQGVSSPSIIPQTQKLLGPGDSKRAFNEFLAKNKNFQKEQATLNTAQRAERIQAYQRGYDQAISNGATAEEAHNAAMANLSGAFNKVSNTNTEIAKQFGQVDRSNIINEIKNTKLLNDYEKIPAIKAFQAFLDEGKVPVKNELEKLSKVLGPDVVAKMAPNPSGVEKIASFLGLGKSLKSTLDLSAPFRQGIVLAAAHPRDFSRSFTKMFGYAASPKKFERFFEELGKRPTYLKMREAGVDFTDVNGDLSKLEEAYGSTLINKVPVLRTVVGASNRAYAGFLNHLRADAFDTIYKGLSESQKVDEKTLRDLGSFINNATGRGDLSKIPIGGKQLQAASPLLNSIFFSPRLMASRINLLNPVYYAKLSPAVRKEALKAQVGFVGAGLSILGLAKLAGADVGTNPTSADFGKIKLGDGTRYDIWGGFQQYATFIAREILNQTTNSTTGEVRKFGVGFNAPTRLSTAGNFARSKLAPLPGAVVDIAQGKDYAGNPVTPTSIVRNQIEPFILNDLQDTIKTYGAFGPVVAIPGLFGVGSQTYNEKTNTAKAGRPAKSSIGRGSTRRSSVTLGTRIGR